MRVYKYSTSSVEITSLMNGSRIHERWMEWSELYQRIENILNFDLNTQHDELKNQGHILGRWNSRQRYN